MEPNPFTEQGKTLSCEVRDIINRFVRTGSVQPEIGGNRLRTARADDVVLYMEFCKRQRPSMYAAEVQNVTRLAWLGLGGQINRQKPCVDLSANLLSTKVSKSSYVKTVRWPNSETLVSACVYIWSRPKLATHRKCMAWPVFQSFYSQTREASKIYLVIGFFSVFSFY